MGERKEEGVSVGWCWKKECQYLCVILFTKSNQLFTDSIYQWQLIPSSAHSSHHPQHLIPSGHISEMSSTSLVLVHAHTQIHTQIHTHTVAQTHTSPHKCTRTCINTLTRRGVSAMITGEYKNQRLELFISLSLSLSSTHVAVFFYRFYWDFICCLCGQPLKKKKKIFIPPVFEHGKYQLFDTVSFP